MSIRLMSMAFGLDLQPSRKLVLIALCDHADDAGGSCHPSIARLAIKASISERQCKRILAELEADGYFSVVGNKLGGKPGSTKHFRINIKALETGDKLSPLNDETGDTHDIGGVTSVARGVTPMTETGDTHDTLTIIEPSIEPSIEPKDSDESLCSLITAKTLVSDYGIDKQVAEDFMKVRKAKRQPVTATAWDRLISEFQKAGLSISDGVRMCAENGWGGFRASWLDGKKITTNQSSHTGFDKREYTEHIPDWAQEAIDEAEGKA